MHNASLRPAIQLHARRWFIVGLALVFIAAAWQYTAKIMKSPSRSAIQRWHDQILLDVDSGVDISQRFQYPNPPIMAVLLYPLAKLPDLTGALLWFAIKVGFALICFFWVFRLIAPPPSTAQWEHDGTAGAPFPAWAQALAVLLSLRPILGDLQHGNVNLFILFLVIAGLTAFRYRHDFSAGLLLALAIACKVTPALLLPYFVWKRAWTTLAGAAVGLMLFLWPGFVPAGFIGWEQNQQQLTSWYREMVQPFVVEGKVWSEHNNQSLPGLATRMLTASPSFSHYDANNAYVADQCYNIVNLDPAVVRWVVKGCMGVFALAVVWSCRTPTTQRSGWRLGAEFAFIVLGMLLFSERTWKHHCVTLMLPFAVLCYYLAACRPGPWLRSYLIATVVAVGVLMETTSISLLDRDFAKMAQVYGAYVWAYLLLMAALVVLLTRSSHHQDTKDTKISNARKECELAAAR